MEVLLIGEAKMKIVLTAEETKKYALDIPEPSKEAHKARRAFWNVLDEARRRARFDPAGDKVLVQFYPMESGGCEIFVTKLGILSPSTAKLVSESDRVTLLSKSRAFYAFSTADDAIGAAVAIKNHPSGVIPKGDLYFLSGIGYVIAIEEFGKGDEQCEFASLIEYGRRLSSELASYISEHGVLLIKETAIKEISAKKQA